MSRFAVCSIKCGSLSRCITTPFSKTPSLSHPPKIKTQIRNSTFVRPTSKILPFNRYQWDCLTKLKLDIPYYATNTRNYHISHFFQQPKTNTGIGGIQPDFGAPKLSSNPNWKKYTQEEQKITHELARELKDEFHELKTAADDLIDEMQGNIAQLFESGEYQLCIEAADKFLEESDPYSVDALQYKAMSLNKLSKFDEATEIFEQAKLYVEMWDLHDEGLRLASKGDNDSALLCYNRVLEVMPRVAEVWMNKANSLSELGKHEEAIEAIEEASELDPNDVMVMWTRATIYQVAGEYEDAILCLNDVLDHYPGKTEIHFCKGYCFAKMGKDEEAIRCFDIVLNTNPTDVDTLFNKAISQQALGKYEEALQTFNKIKEGSKTSHEVEYNQGICFSALGRFEQAIARYDAALRIKPDFTDALYNKGTAHLYLEQPEKAIACYDKVIASQDKNAHEAYYNKGIVLFSFEKLEAALENFTAACQAEHRVAAYHYCRGMCLEKLGRKGEAAEAYAIAKRLDPNVIEELKGIFAQ